MHSRDRSGVVLILVRVPELRSSRVVPPCPAAMKVAGVDGGSCGVVCRAMQRDIERDDGTELGMSAGQFGFLQHEANAGVLLTVKSDPTTLLNLCHGRGLPVITSEDHQASDHYTYCAVWQAEKQRIADGRDSLVAERQPEPVAMGVATHELADPWAAARRGLDELVPQT